MGLGHSTTTVRTQRRDMLGTYGERLCACLQRLRSEVSEQQRDIRATNSYTLPRNVMFFAHDDFTYFVDLQAFRTPSMHQLQETGESGGSKKAAACTDKLRVALTTGVIKVFLHAYRQTEIGLQQ